MSEDGPMSDVFTTRVLNVSSGSREAVVDLTRECEAFLREEAGGRDGLLNVFIPHATAGQVGHQTDCTLRSRASGMATARFTSCGRTAPA